MLVLIIDDSEFIRNNLMRLLVSSNLNIRIEEAFDVNSGKAMIEKLKPELIVIDIRMPGGSGFDVLKHAKETSPGSKIIILTNFANDQYKKKSLSEGADYFFDKSIEFNKIIDVIENDFQIK
jgi:DNA-binding NarL/FixJ family response regulator